MQNLARDEAGNLWEVDGAGNAVRLHQAAPRQAGRVISLPPSPKEQRSEARASAAEARAEAAARREQARFEQETNPEGALDPQTTTFYAQQVLAGSPMPPLGMGKQAAASRQAIMREVARLAGASGRSGEDLARQIAHYKAGTKQLGTLETMLGTIRQNEQTALLNGQQFIDRSTELPGQTRFPLVNSIVQGVERATGNSTIAAHDAAWNTFVNEYAKVVSGSPSGAGTMSDSARHEAMETMRGNYSLDQKKAAFEQMKRDMENRITAIHQGINEGYQHLTQTPGYEVPETTSGITAARQHADAELPGSAAGVPPKPEAPGLLDGPGGPDGPQDPNGGVQTSAASGQTRTVHDPRMSAQMDALINAGASPAVINATLKRQGFPTMNPGDYLRARQWMKENPGKKYFGSDASRNEDLSLMQQAAGSKLGALLAHTGNMGSAGLAAAMAGPTGQGALDAMSVAHPGWSTAGDLVGGVTGTVGAEAALASRAPAALARFAPRIADTLYGASLGFNQAREGEGGIGALEGAGAGLLGGMVGQKVAGGATRVLRGVADPAVQYLRARGVPLTVGQALANGGLVGRTVKGVEDALTSLPGVGNMVDARRMEGLTAFNRAAFQDAAAPGAQITATGAPGMAQVRQSVGDAYDRALDPVTIDPTEPAFGADIQDAIAAAQAIPNVNSAQDAALAGLGSRIDGAVGPITGNIPGRNFQEAYRGLARTGRERANNDYGHEVGQVMRQGQDALGGALERQNPGAFDAFIEANAANRRANVLADALRNAGNQTDEMITPAQLNRADIGSTSRLEGRINSAAGNRPFYDLAQAGQRVLPSKLPDSGTARRAIVGALTTGALGGGGAALGGQEGAGYGTAGGLALSAALALGGSRPAQRAMVSLLADRPDFAIHIAEQLANSPAFRRIAGSTGAGATAGYLTGN